MEIKKCIKLSNIKALNLILEKLKEEEKKITQLLLKIIVN